MNKLFLIFLIFNSINLFANAEKFPVSEKILFTSANRAVVEYTLQEDVNDLEIKIYPVKRTIIWQKIIEGITSDKKKNQTIRVEVEVDPNATTERSMVGLQFSGIVDGKKRIGVSSLTFSDPSVRDSGRSKKVKVDKTGKKLRVVPMKEG